MIEKIIISILVIALVVLIIILKKKVNKSLSNTENVDTSRVDKVKAQLKELEMRVSEKEEKCNELDKSINEKNNKLNAICDEYVEKEHQLYAAMDVKRSNFEAQFEGMEKDINNKRDALKEIQAQVEVAYKDQQDKMDALQKIIDERQQELNDASVKLGDVKDKVNDGALKIASYETLMAEYEGKIEAQRKGFEKEKVAWEKELEAIKKSYIAATEKYYDERTGGEGKVTTLKPLNDAEKRICGLVEELCCDSRVIESGLAVEFKKIIWSKIWMPRIQKMGLDKKSGIYKLTWVEDGLPKVYIGQAKDIKDRWYTHFKKMLGIENVGKEELYKVVDGKPEKVVWEVVEFVDEDKLNERERWWIEFYESDKFGLNMKK